MSGTEKLKFDLGGCDAGLKNTPKCVRRNVVHKCSCRKNKGKAFFCAFHFGNRAEHSECGGDAQKEAHEKHKKCVIAEIAELIETEEYVTWIENVLDHADAEEDIGRIRNTLAGLKELANTLFVKVNEGKTIKIRGEFISFMDALSSFHDERSARDQKHSASEHAKSNVDSLKDRLEELRRGKVDIKTKCTKLKDERLATELNLSESANATIERQKIADREEERLQLLFDAADVKRTRRIEELTKTKTVRDKYVELIDTAEAIDTRRDECRAAREARLAVLESAQQDANVVEMTTQVRNAHHAYQEHVRYSRECGDADQHAQRLLIEKLARIVSDISEMAISIASLERDEPIILAEIAEAEAGVKRLADELSVLDCACAVAKKHVDKKRGAFFDSLKQ